MGVPPNHFVRFGWVPTSPRSTTIVPGHTCFFSLFIQLYIVKDTERTVRFSERIFRRIFFGLSRVATTIYGKNVPLVRVSPTRTNDDCGGPFYFRKEHLVTFPSIDVDEFNYRIRQDDDDDEDDDAAADDDNDDHSVQYTYNSYLYGRGGTECPTQCRTVPSHDHGGVSTIAGSTGRIVHPCHSARRNRPTTTIIDIVGIATVIGIVVPRDTGILSRGRLG